MQKVFIPHVPSRYDPITERRVPVFDMQPATKYGELVFLTSMGDSVRGQINKRLLAQMKDVISDMNRDDYILCMGDPILNSAAIKYATDKNGRVKVLRWDKNRKDYDVTEIEL